MRSLRLLFQPSPALIAPSSDLGTTSWGLLKQCASPDPELAATALATVCWRYRPAILAYVRGHTASAQDVEDLSQGFFVHLLDQGLLLQADPARGRFRAFLFTSLQHYLGGEADRQGAAKRGGDVILVPLDNSLEEGRAKVAVVSPPEHVRRGREEARFDRHWAGALLDGVLDDLAAECQRTHGTGAFTHFMPFLPGGEGENTEEEHGRAAVAVDLSLAAFRSALHRWRDRYKVLLREAVALTVNGTAGEINAELRHLAAALAAGPAE